MPWARTRQRRTITSVKEGKDYSLADLRQVLQQEFEKEYPGEKFDAPPLPAASSKR